MRPAYCPNCGAKLKKADDAVKEIPAAAHEEYACHCKECGWRGKLVPDGGQEDK